jgi:Patatin-like phospholipase
MTQVVLAILALVGFALVVRFYPWSAYIYYLRVPLITWLLLVMMGPLFTSSMCGSFTRNLLNVDGWGLFFVAVVSSFAALAAAYTGYLILAYGMMRLAEQPSSRSAAAIFLQWTKWHVAIVVLLLSGPQFVLCWYCYKYSPSLWIIPLFPERLGMRHLLVQLVAVVFSRKDVVLIVVAGIVCADLLALLAHELHEAARFWFARWINFVHWRQEGFPPLVLAALRSLGRGYVGFRDEEPEIVLTGHILASALLLIFYLAYFIIGTVRQQQLTGAREVSHWFPTLAFILVALTFATFLFSALTFFLDRYRIPLLVPLVLFAFSAASWSGTDHFFRIQDIGMRPAPPPRGKIGDGERVIVVAAAGGGIQAAGWTAQVLSGLAMRDQRFPSAVRLISAVSGGSVGTMYYVDAQRRALADPMKAEVEYANAIDNAVEPSLDAIAWGLVSEDLAHALFPVRCHLLKDRGWALERSFAQRGVGEVVLSDWSDERLPVVLFNSTLVESGRPLVFSTGRFPDKTEGVVNFTGSLGRDLSIVTAVRLSSTFPFVTPAARPLENGRPVTEHIADGGYFDNYGMLSLMIWLRTALGSYRRTKPNILVLRIESFPEAAALAPRARSWTYQLWAPLDAMLSVRETAQRIRDEAEFNLFKGNTRDKADIADVVFRYTPPKGCAAPSLSWDLTELEKSCIRRAWSKEADVEKVIEFLSEKPIN